MTQKELLYLEDAIGHEQSIITICEETADYLEDKNLISFMKTEKRKHESTKNKLIKLLEGKSNE